MIRTLLVSATTVTLSAAVSLFAPHQVAFAQKTEATKKPEKPKADVKKSETVKAAPKKETKGKNKNMIYVTMETSMGAIKLELDKEKAPKTVENFVNYVNSGHYNKTIFHRVIAGFMIQGGGMDEKMTEKSTKAPIENEAKNGLQNDKYTVAMARTNDPNSATAQFFINVADNTFLNYTPTNPGYAVFGKVVDGTDVVDKIAKVKTGQKGFYADVPTTTVVIESAKVEK